MKKETIKNYFLWNENIGVHTLWKKKYVTVWGFITGLITFPVMIWFYTLPKVFNKKLF